MPARVARNGGDMTEFGYWLSSEEHAPLDLVANARRAEEAGFSFAMISDHFHPWIDAPGPEPVRLERDRRRSANATESLIRLGTGVTCPLIRTHPAIVAHAAATSGRADAAAASSSALGTGENLNEHVTGARWPAPDERLEMLEEAIEVMRLLWQGGEQTHRGRHYTVDHARLYTLPDEPAADRGRGREADCGRARGQARRRLRHDRPRRRARRGVPRGRRRRAALRPGQALLGRGRAAGEEDSSTSCGRPPRSAARSGQELPRPSDFDAAVEERDGGADGRGNAVRARPRARARADPDVGAGRLRPHRAAPGRAGPGRLLPLLARGAAAPARLTAWPASGPARPRFD